ncbi:MAG: hypothetical protein A2519_06525 [Candidatus Raymondbacteria bacterium RIFOXYD12_FULL_49_13]|uniref:Calx-beta domain-containing protein n=1 Tax=Candidatus Raymondbacteria bacterium RIFOXYD12_FULL_49_13 TaxID=1817890 RepID=A0A1F7F8K4_UNCRA|nr:MAG: hypothetical protein A2519_06525 [Candidatus Raymondbacteria bacterium RIFOXYD12_FULL_49_13]
MINRDAAAAKTINCSLSNLPGSVAGLSMYRTSSTENCVDAGQVAVSAGSFSGVLPAYSITTFTGAMGTQKGALQFTSADWSSFENGAYGTNPLIIAVTRTGGSSGAVSVNFTTSNGTATAGSDYTAVSGTLNWADGDVTNKTFAVSILNDAICEGNETINLTLSSPTGGATPGTPSEAVLTIVERAGVLQYSAANFSVNENSGTATVSVKRSDGSAGAVSVDYRTIDRTATAGSDYTAVSGTLSWADGDTANKTFTVPVLDDAVYEGEETVTLAISNPTGGARLGSVYPGPMITMVDNDPAPPAGALLFGAPVYYDGRYRVMESGGSFQPNLSPVTIAVQRVGGSVGAVSVNYATGNGTATAGSDYTAVSGTLSWADGDTVSKTFTVSTLDDAVYEGDETVNLTLSNPTGGAALVPDRSADVLIIMENDTTHIVVSSQFSADKEDIAPFLTAYPSPFNPVVNFAFSAGRQGLLPSSAVKLRIYDLRGVLIKELSPKSSGQGVCRLTWDGRDCNGRPLSSQIFVVRLTAGRQVVTGKVIMMK